MGRSPNSELDSLGDRPLWSIFSSPVAMHVTRNCLPACLSYDEEEEERMREEKRREEITRTSQRTEICSICES